MKEESAKHNPVLVPSPGMFSQRSSDIFDISQGCHYNCRLLHPLLYSINPRDDRDSNRTDDARLAEMAEVSSLLSLSLPNTNVGFLVDADKEAEAVAVEVRPRQRPFRSAREFHTFIELLHTRKLSTVQCDHSGR